MIKLFSQSKKDAIKKLKPDLGLRDWNELTPEEIEKIWYHLEWYFFNKNIKKEYGIVGGLEKEYYDFYGEPSDKIRKQKAIILSIKQLNEDYKAKSFAKKFLVNQTLNNACLDFYDIFISEDEVVVFELLSMYSKAIYYLTKNADYIYKKEKESEQEFQKRKIDVSFKVFDKFASRLNDIFEQFCINYYLTRDGFITRQDKKIIEDIYVPVLNFLINEEKWSEVNGLLKDAFRDYRQKDYSGCLTNTTSSLQAFLQILVKDKTGKGEISKLIQEAMKKNLIPNDEFTKNVFKNLDSIFAQKRQNEGDAHPKKEYASEKSARLILNLVMIFLQHCIQ